jgi:formamidopyrimidine-DNA glycosylase
MLELPEARTIARQLNETVIGKRIVFAQAAASPHGFAWYFGEPMLYGKMLTGKVITGTAAYGGKPEIVAEDIHISFCDGVNIRYIKKGMRRPAKHQLIVEFEDGDAIICTIQMYGGIFAFPKDANEDFYYQVGKNKPDPLSDDFNFSYFASLLTAEARGISAKAFLATKQRIPGLGNGVLQDILWIAKIHPKRKMSALSENEFATMFTTVKKTLADMTDKGGRDVEKDLFGKPGGYVTTMSKNGVNHPCPACGDIIYRMAYMGGNVYACKGCQKSKG